MPNIYDEIRIVFRGPCERLFIAYKPLGWHVCSPSGRKPLDDSLSSVIGAKLQITQDSIKFPSKLRINQKGLVIGTTDDSMYSQISRMISNGQCSKTYTCLVDLTLNSFLSKTNSLNLDLNTQPILDAQLSGTINFNLVKLTKNSPTDPDIQVESNPGSNSHSLKFRLTSLDTLLLNPENGFNIGGFETDRYSVLDLETTDKLVDKHIQQILDQLNIRIVDEFDKKLNEKYKIMHLSRIQLPHPIFTGRTISTSINSPFDAWVRHLP